MTLRTIQLQIAMKAMASFLYERYVTSQKLICDTFACLASSVQDYNIIISAST